MRLAIGDIHGKPFWEHFLDEDFTEYYILGDYFDSYGLSFKQEYANFQRLRDAARQDSRLKLCLGNHDYHYLKDISYNEQYSRFEEEHCEVIQEILEDTMELFRVVYITPDHNLISHAGVSRAFMQKAGDMGFETPESLNDAFSQDRLLFAFDGYNLSGDDITQGPLWIRPKSLKQDALPGYTHIVGHTPQAGITESLANDGVTRCVFIDTGNNESVYRF
jgi:UDP-2,3-diacylglucosamine pyrophosphatase LpxH